LQQLRETSMASNGHTNGNAFNTTSSCRTRPPLSAGAFATNSANVAAVAAAAASAAAAVKVVCTCPTTFILAALRAERYSDAIEQWERLGVGVTADETVATAAAAAAAGATAAAYGNAALPMSPLSSPPPPLQPYKHRCALAGRCGVRHLGDK
jgi:hypothetical protein